MNVPCVSRFIEVKPQPMAWALEKKIFNIDTKFFVKNIPYFKEHT